MNPTANVLVLRHFNVHHKDWLTYSRGTDRSGELCYNFSVSNDSHSLALLDLFLSSDASICSTMDFPSSENSDHVVVLVSIDFPSNSRSRMPCFMA